jgi:hypothetical protein
MFKDKVEVKRLLSAGIIREVAYLEWLASHGQEIQWQVEDVHRLHRPQQACSKDEFLLPRIESLVDATAT